MTTPELIAYIKKQKETGTSEDHMRAGLLSQGWKMEDIDEAEALLSGGIPLPPPTLYSNTSTLKTGMLAWVQVLISIPLIFQILLAIIYLLQFPLHLSYAFHITYNGPSFLQIITVALVRSKSYATILIVALGILSISGIVLNYFIKKQTGQKSKFLQNTNSSSLVLIIVWIIIWIFLPTFWF